MNHQPLVQRLEAYSHFLRIFIDWICFLFVLWLIELLRGWKFDEIEDKSSSTEKPISFSAWS
jgi:hypothetical protein